MKFEVRDNIQIHVWQDLEKKLNWIFAPRQMPQYVVECAENFHEATDVSRKLAARKSIAERCDVFWKWTLKTHSERCMRTRLFLRMENQNNFVSDNFHEGIISMIWTGFDITNFRVGSWVFRWNWIKEKEREGLAEK